jgi:hypothetical protein
MTIVAIEGGKNELALRRTNRTARARMPGLGILTRKMGETRMVMPWEKGGGWERKRRRNERLRPESPLCLSS